MSEQRRIQKRSFLSVDDSSSSKNISFGKWTSKEEIFAEQLISAFDKGELNDCAEGTTLRVYLAKKLNCVPMRISKKFAGKHIGKVSCVFPSRISFEFLFFELIEYLHYWWTKHNSSEC